MTPFARSFARLFVPLAVAILLGKHIHSEFRARIERERIVVNETLGVGLASGVLNRRLQVVVSDLLALAGSSDLHALANHPDPAARTRVIDDFIAFSRAKPAYDRVRWIGRDGYEVARVDHQDGTPADVDRAPPAYLGDRYYFTETMALAPQEIFVSALDLSIEHGELEQPYKPMLRVATPVAGNGNETLGTLVLNYRANDMLDLVRTVSTPASKHLAVVNQDGYYVLAPDRADEWGFMLERSEATLAHRHPSSGARMLAAGKGQFEDTDGLWTFETVHPLRAARAGRGPAQDPGPEPRAGAVPAAAAGQDYRWIVVNHLSPAQLQALQQDVHPLQWVIVIALLGGSAVASGLLARVRVRESDLESRLRIYFERSTVGMAVVNPDGTWRVVNPALCNIMGYDEPKLLSMHARDLAHPDDDAISSDSRYQRVQRGELDNFALTKRFIRGDGRTIDARVTVQAVRDGAGAVDSYLAMFEDITARLATEQALHASEERIRLLGDNLPDSYIYQSTVGADGQRRFVYLSSGLTRIQGLNPDDVIANPELMMENTDPAQAGELRARQLESQLTLRDFSMELRVRLADGSWGWVLVRSRPRRLDDGSILWDGVATNITAWRHAQALLDLQKRRAEALLELPRHSKRLSERAFMQHALGLIARMTDSPVAFLHCVGDDGEAVEPVVWAAAPADGAAPVGDTGPWAAAGRTRAPLVINERAGAPGGQETPDGPSGPQRLIGVPVVDDGRLRLMTGVGDKHVPYDETDVETIQLIASETWRILRQRRSDEALQIANQVVGASPVVCCRLRAVAGWPVVYVSDNVARWGYRVDDLMRGQPSFSQIVHPGDLARVIGEVSRFTAAGRDAYDQEFRLLTADGGELWVLGRTTVQRDRSGAVEFYDGMFTDISERRRQEQDLAANLETQLALNKRLEEAHDQLLQSEKLASIGQLAAGVAHELNNPIGFVNSNLGTLDRYLADIMRIVDAYDRAAAARGDPTEGLAAVARLKAACDFDFIRNDIKPLMADSRDGIARVSRIVRDLKSFSHSSEQEWGWADLHAGIESTLNIVRNELKYKCELVRDFGDLPEIWCIASQLNQVFMNLLVNAGQAIETSGTITIRTRCATNDGEVRIEIADTGQGIAAQNLSRIFDPFFTTKRIGTGTGLGLSLSYGIVQRHRGRIEVESEVGKGSLFRVCLPIKPAEAEPASPPGA